jgi:hypothetical protein
MLKRNLLIPSIVSLVYVLFCIMAFAFHITRYETDKFSGMFIALFTLPWSLFGALCYDFIISPIFFEFHDFLMIIIMSVGVILNAALIFFVSKKYMDNA